MPRGGRSVFSGRERGAGLWDELKASFGFPAGLAMVAGLVLGFGLPTIDAWLLIEIPTFAFDTQEAATGLLETVATATVAVAGIAFSVTVVAFTLTSQQLSPRVLRSFRSDRLSQAVLALFLGTFIFCLVLLVRLGVRDSEGVPNLSITVALLLALASFGLFAMFIGHIARMLQPSTVIATIVDEAKGSLDRLYPGQIGQSPDRRGAVDDEASARMERPASLTVEAEAEGYLRRIEGETLIAAARRNGALVRQRVPIGDYVTPGRRWRTSGPTTCPTKSVRSSANGCAIASCSASSAASPATWPSRSGSSPTSRSRECRRGSTTRPPRRTRSRRRRRS